MADEPTLADQIIEQGPYEAWKPLAGWLRLRNLAVEDLNELRDGLVAARQAREGLKRFEVEALGDYLGEGRIWLRCDRCHAWAADISGPLTLAELGQRAGEHAEVCP